MTREHARLFSDGSRSDRAHRGLAESNFAFLDRVDQPYWERIRQELDRWFAAYPSGQAARDLRNRFRKDDEGQHLGAWWELYLHRLFTCLGYSLEVHPKLKGTTARPDFRVEGPGQTFLLEAATILSGIDDGEPHSPLESVFLDIVEGARADRFTVMLEFEQLGTDMPRAGEILRRIESWLDTLPDSDQNAHGEARCLLEIRDWRLELIAFPVAPAHRGESIPLLASGPGIAGMVNDTEKLRGTLNRKHRKHRGYQGSDPFVVAALMPSTFADLDAVEKALFGDTALQYHLGQRGNERWVRLRNGFWTQTSGPRATWASAVITGFQIEPGAAVATKWPRLWPNPSAAVPFAADLPLPRSSGSTAAQFRHEDPDGPYPPRDLFGLPPDWPGPERPFSKPSD